MCNTKYSVVYTLQMTEVESKLAESEALVSLLREELDTLKQENRECTNAQYVCVYKACPAKVYGTVSSVCMVLAKHSGIIL